MSAFTLHSIVISREAQAESGGNTGGRAESAVATVLGRIARRHVRNTSVAAGQSEPGSSLVETDALLVIVEFADNPGVAFAGVDGSCIIVAGDYLRQGDSAMTHISGRTLEVERVRVYDDGVQIDLRGGVEG